MDDWNSRMRRGVHGPEEVFDTIMGKVLKRTRDSKPPGQEVGIELGK